MPAIDKLIKNIPENQIELLKEIWDSFLKAKEWPKGKPFRRDRRSTIEKLIADLDPIFVWHYKDNPKEEYYRLTTEGVYAVEGFEGANIKLLLSYLDFLRDKFDKDPDFKQVRAQELLKKSLINPEDVRILGELLDMGNTKLWGAHADNLRTSDWTAGVVKDIEDLYEKGSQEFLYKQWDDYIFKWIITHRSNKSPGILGSIESQIGGLAMNFRNEAEGTAFEYDVFICHASEDEESFVRELAETLNSKGLRVWYHESTLSLGDSLRRSIDKGLVKSRYGVVVLSEIFFRKDWPQKELDGLVARENGLDKVILPIWHGVTKEIVQSYSPILADRLAASTDKGLEYVVDEILKVVKPNEYTTEPAKIIEREDKILQNSIEIYYATSDFLHSAGNEIEDLNARKGKAWTIAETPDQIKFLIYGPYKALPDRGQYIAYFKLKIDNNQRENYVCEIDVCSISTPSVHTKKRIKGVDFDQPNNYKFFEIEFEYTDELDMEYRLLLLKKSKITIDYVAVVNKESLMPEDVLFVTLAYKGILWRPPDELGCKIYLGQLRKGEISRDRMLEVLLESDEYADRTKMSEIDGTDEGFVKGLYNKLLNREGGGNEVRDWVRRLEGRLSRIQVFNGFYNSPEFEQKHQKRMQT